MDFKINNIQQVNQIDQENQYEIWPWEVSCFLLALSTKFAVRFTIYLDSHS